MCVLLIANCKDYYLRIGGSKTVSAIEVLTQSACKLSWLNRSAWHHSEVQLSGPSGVHTMGTGCWARIHDTVYILEDIHPFWIAPDETGGDALDAGWLLVAQDPFRDVGQYLEPREPGPTGAPQVMEGELVDPLRLEAALAPRESLAEHFGVGASGRVALGRAHPGGFFGQALERAQVLDDLISQRADVSLVLFVVLVRNRPGLLLEVDIVPTGESQLAAASIGEQQD